MAHIIAEPTHNTTGCNSTVGCHGVSATTTTAGGATTTTQAGTTTTTIEGETTTTIEGETTTTLEGQTHDHSD